MLAKSQPTHAGRALTLIVMTRAQVEVNAVWTDATLVDSFARVRSLIASFNVSRTLSCPLGRWDLAAIVETCEDGGKAVGETSREEEPVACVSSVCGWPSLCGMAHMSHPI